MAHQVKNLPYSNDAILGISAETMQTHHDKLYAGYVNKRNEIEQQLTTTDKNSAHHNYSPFRGLKLEESFNANGQILHELYFDSLGSVKEGENKPTGKLLEKIEADFGSFEAFVEDLKATCMAARGWVITALDLSDGKLHNFLSDFHSHGGIWGAVPILAVDVYEHAFFADYGADKKGYVENVLKTLDWPKISEKSSKLLQANSL